MLGVIFLLLLPLYVLLLRDPNRSSIEYYGNLAAIRAFIFFSWCLLISYPTGVFDGVFVTGWDHLSSYNSDTLWVTLTVVLFIIIILGYWIIWPIGTVTYGRKKYGCKYYYQEYGIPM